SVVVSVVVVLVCANASGETSAQARAIIVLFIYASLICCFDYWSPASCQATRQASLDHSMSVFPLDGCRPPLFEARTSLSLIRRRDQPDARSRCSRRTRLHVRRA